VEFWDMIHAGRPAATIFRLKYDDGRTPLILQGWPEPEKDVYSGFLKEAFLPGGYNSACYNAQLQMRVGDADYPVFTVDMKKKKLCDANTAAQMLFWGEKQAEQELVLDDVVPQSLQKGFVATLEEAIERDAWSGKLLLGNAERGLFSAHARLTVWGEPGKEVVRAALVNVDAKPIKLGEDDVLALCPGELRPALEKLRMLCDPAVDGLMLSHIQMGSGRVAVYGVGAVFEGLEWGTLHAYEGTIAQDIQRYSLSSLIVEDTLNSVKSIDWALFAPQGVRSYFAKPFYAEHGLHAVLILASKRQHAFGADAEALYTDVADAFGQLMLRWRNH
ncbi:MAG: hypothetical protein PHI96_10020, partial [Desulfovibrio sp.]|nr:hypothetical protein [Desulfovibrio sp.]